MSLMILFFSTQALNARIWELVRRNPVDNGFRKEALAVVDSTLPWQPRLFQATSDQEAQN
jgi:hypothetical protein